MSYNLVVVDMQPHFEASNDKRTIKNVISLMRKAVRDEANVIILEYAGYGLTNRYILNFFHDKINHEKKLKVIKYCDDGGETLVRNLKEAKFIKSKYKKEFILCGVNTGCCVARTARGLRKALPKSKITIAIHACNQPERLERYEECNTNNLISELPKENNIWCIGKKSWHNNFRY